QQFVPTGGSQPVGEAVRPQDLPVAAHDPGRRRKAERRFPPPPAAAAPSLRWPGCADPPADQPKHSLPEKALPMRHPQSLHGREMSSLLREALPLHLLMSATVEPSARARPMPAPTTEVPRRTRVLPSTPLTRAASR